MSTQEERILAVAKWLRDRDIKGQASILEQAVALLREEHRMALIRARNQGREEAVSELRRAGYGETGDMIPRIRAMMEAEK